MALGTDDYVILLVSLAGLALIAAALLALLGPAPPSPPAEDTAAARRRVRACVRPPVGRSAAIDEMIERVVFRFGYFFLPCEQAEEEEAELAAALPQNRAARRRRGESRGQSVGWIVLLTIGRRKEC